MERSAKGTELMQQFEALKQQCDGLVQALQSSGRIDLPSPLVELIPDIAQDWEHWLVTVGNSFLSDELPPEELIVLLDQALRYLVRFLFALGPHAPFAAEYFHFTVLMAPGFLIALAPKLEPFQRLVTASALSAALATWLMFAEGIVALLRHQTPPEGADAVAAAVYPVLKTLLQVINFLPDANFNILQGLQMVLKQVGLPDEKPRLPA